MLLPQKAHHSYSSSFCCCVYCLQKHYFSIFLFLFAPCHSYSCLLGIQQPLIFLTSRDSKGQQRHKFNLVHLRKLLQTNWTNRLHLVPSQPWHVKETHKVFHGSMNKLTACVPLPSNIWIDVDTWFAWLCVEHKIWCKEYKGQISRSTVCIMHVFWELRPSVCVCNSTIATIHD